jgi:hypothetical protein
MENKNEKSVKINAEASKKNKDLKTKTLPIPTYKLTSSSEDNTPSSSSSYKRSFFQLATSSSSQGSRSRSHSNESLRSPKKLSPKQSTSIPSIELVGETIFNLDLETMIDPDNSFMYGKTLAYCGDKFLAQQKMIGEYHEAQELTESQYIAYKTCPLNTIQIEKITIIKALISILNNAYHLVKRSAMEHEDISNEILSITELSMCSSLEKWKTTLLEIAKTNRYASWKEEVKPSAHTASLWESLEFGIMLQKTELQEYKELINKLVAAMESLFILNDKVMKSISSSSSNIQEIAYITLNKVEALCQPNLKRELRKQFIKNYIEENKSSEMQFTSLHDLFSSIHAQKDNLQPESMPYKLVGLILINAYPDQYHNFMQSVSATHLEAGNRNHSFSK